MLYFKVFMSLILMTSHLQASETHFDYYEEVESSVTSAGSGCPEGSMWHYTGEGEEKTLTLYFNDYLTESKKLSRKNCTIALQTIVPTGYQITITAAQTLIHSYQSYKAKLKAHLNVFFPGQEGSSENLEITSENDGFKVLNITNETKSTCGESTNLRINSSLLQRKGSPSDYYSYGAILGIKVSYKITEC